MRGGQGVVDLVNVKEGLEDKQKTLVDDKTFRADLATSCETKEAEWQVRQKTHSEEVGLGARERKLQALSKLRLYQLERQPDPPCGQHAGVWHEWNREAQKGLRYNGWEHPQLEARH